MFVSFKRFIKKRKRQSRVIICLLFAFVWISSIMVISVPNIVPDNSEANFQQNNEESQLSEAFHHHFSNLKQGEKIIKSQNVSMYYSALPDKNSNNLLLIRPTTLGQFSRPPKSLIQNLNRNGRLRRFLRELRLRRDSNSDDGSGLITNDPSTISPKSSSTRKLNRYWTPTATSSDEVTTSTTVNATVTTSTTTTTTTTPNMCENIPLDVYFPQKHVKSQSVRVRWTLPNVLSNRNVTMLIYLLEGRTPIKHTFTTAKLYTFDKLKPCTEYIACVKIHLNECFQRNTQDVCNKIKTTPPEIMIHNLLSNCAVKEANISWDALPKQCADTFKSTPVVLEHYRNLIRDGTEILVNYTSTSYMFANLLPYTNYSFKVFLNGTSDFKSTECRTRPGKPGKVNDFTLNCTFNKADQSNLAIMNWAPPNEAKGILEKYTITYNLSKDEGVCPNKSSGRKENLESSKTYYTMTLCEESNYTFTIQAKNKDVDDLGKSETKSCTTPAGVPPKCDEQGFSVSLNSSNGILITFKRSMFSNEKGRITHYAIVLAESKCNDQQKQGYRNTILSTGQDNLTCDGHRPNVTKLNNSFNGGKDREYFVIGSLNPGTNYSVKVRAFNSIGFTDSFVLYIQIPADPAEPEEESLTLVISIFVLILLITLIALLLFVLKKKDILIAIRNFRNIKCANPGLNMATIPVRVTSKPIFLADFEEHYQTMLSDSSLKFSMEFEELGVASPTSPITAAKMVENHPKNRWVNILPFDHSRVKLLPIADDVSTDYINASYIPGYTSKREYIASQGPLPSTKDDFWRMIWEQNSQMIVMVTQCVERGKVKCEQYWPSGHETHYYGDLAVKLKSESILTEYTLRIFELQLGVRTVDVKQMHFTMWPDFGCPENTSILLNFVRSVRDHMPREPSGPVIVHCSAGVGRTGTYIAVDKLMQHINDKDVVDIYGTVREMRNYRTNMVQTEDQYVYIHECVKDLLIEMQSCRQSVYSETGELLEKSDSTEIAEIHVASRKGFSDPNIYGLSDDAISEITETACLLSCSTTHTEMSDKTDTFRSEMTDSTSVHSNNSEVFEVLASAETNEINQLVLLREDKLNCAESDNISLSQLSDASQTRVTNRNTLIPETTISFFEDRNSIACNDNTITRSSNQTNIAWKFHDNGCFF